MIILRNIFSIIGLFSVVVFFILVYKMEPAYHIFNNFDDKALETYTKLATDILETGNAAEATVWKTKVQKGLGTEDVEDAMRSVANEHNIKNVGELPLSKQVEAMSGKPFRYMKIFMFCNALTAARMVDYSDAFSAYLPCRVTLLEDKQGQLWLYSLNMDLMIHGGSPLPVELKQEALKVKMIIQDIMARGASGEF
ncbi:hypothetical protein MNBD_GAMMA23-1134 [hydrothermal vent metagenome]|uniref:DUF302 domain-containing protein n=1 Tax=hydrothermal vent metagenome TaxID=652676 RepID=A0A3B1A7J3_9ZZZZ